MKPAEPSKTPTAEFIPENLFLNTLLKWMMEDETAEVDGKDAHVPDLDPDWPLAEQVRGATADGPRNAHASGAPPSRTSPHRR